MLTSINIIVTGKINDLLMKPPMSHHPIRMVFNRLIVLGTSSSVSDPKNSGIKVSDVKIRLF